MTQSFNCVCGNEKGPASRFCPKCEAEILNGTIESLEELKKELLKRTQSKISA